VKNQQAVREKRERPSTEAERIADEVRGLSIDGPLRRLVVEILENAENDPEDETARRLRFLARLNTQGSYIEDCCASFANADWLDDERFRMAYEAATDISVWGVDIRWRCYTLMRASVLGARLDGNFVECGTDRGGTAMAVVRYLSESAFNNRRFFLFDTFEGMHDETLTSEEQALSRRKEGRYQPVFDRVSETFAPYPFVELVKGRVPETLSAYDDAPVAFLHIDMNSVAAETAALEFFWPRLAPGAPVVFDDYGFRFHKVQKEGLDRLMDRLGGNILMLPTGQGILWR